MTYQQGGLHTPAKRFNLGFRADSSTTRAPFDEPLYLARPNEAALIQGEVAFPRCNSGTIIVSRVASWPPWVEAVEVNTPAGLPSISPETGPNRRQRGG